MERLFDTAAALFWKKGYAATSTREIAAALGIQQASLYHHIGSKEDLLYKLCVSSLEQLLTDVRSKIGEVEDPLGRIYVLMRAHLTTLLSYQMRHVTMLTQLRAMSERHYSEILALRKSYADLVRTVLEEAQGAGALRADVPVKYLNLALLNILNWAVVWFRRDQELQADRLTDLFAPIYLTGAARPGAARDAIGGYRAGRRQEGSKSRANTGEDGRQSTSERMLETAAVLFSKKGYEATSTREIAAVLRIQKPSLYYHIQGKEDLLYTICKSSLEQIRKDVEHALEGVEDPLERMGRLFGAHMESMLGDQEKHAATLSEMRALSAPRLAEVIALRDAYERLVRTAIADAQQAGVLRNDIPAKYLSLYLLGLMNRVEVWFRRSGPLSPVQLGDLLLTIFLMGAVGAAGTGT